MLGIAPRGFPALSAGQRRADHGGCEKCGLAQQSVMVLHRPRELLMHKRVGLASRDGDREAPLNSGRIKVTSLQNSVFVCDSVTWGFKKVNQDEENEI